MPPTPRSKDMAPRPENEDVNDLPISPSTQRPPVAELQESRGERRDSGVEKYVDTDTNPNARPPGAGDQDEDAAGAKNDIEREPGGPTPVIGN